MSGDLVIGKFLSVASRRPPGTLQPAFGRCVSPDAGFRREACCPFGDHGPPRGDPGEEAGPEDLADVGERPIDASPAPVGFTRRTVGGSRTRGRRRLREGTEFPMANDGEAQAIDAVLLDMDGTILSSIKAAERVWGAWAARHGLDVEAFLPTIHGMQATETIRRLALPGVDPIVEAAAITRAELDDVEGIEAIAGAAEFLAALADRPWAIVTSAPRELARRRMAAAKLSPPPLMVAAEDVRNSKPAPDGFRLAAERLGTTAERCLVLEDSAAGLAAAESAGARILVVTATHHRPVGFDHPAIRDYRDLMLRPTVDGGLGILRRGADGPSLVLRAAARAPA
jgi:sugar-phosphatase